MAEIFLKRHVIQYFSSFTIPANVLNMFSWIEFIETKQICSNRLLKYIAALSTQVENKIKESLPSRFGLFLMDEQKVQTTILHCLLVIKLIE